jgi:transposase
LDNHASIKPYYEDLPIRIVKAFEKGTSKSAIARLFDVSLSFVKRYARMADWGTLLAPRKGCGRPPKKADETTTKLLKEDVKSVLWPPSKRDVASWSMLPARL